MNNKTAYDILDEMYMEKEAWVGNALKALKATNIGQKAVSYGSRALKSGVAKQALKGAASGATLGAIQGAVQDPGTDANGNKKSRIGNMVRGAATGGAVGGAIGGVAAGAKSINNWGKAKFGNVSPNNAASATTPVQPVVNSKPSAPQANYNTTFSSTLPAMNTNYASYYGKTASEILDEMVKEANTVLGATVGAIGAGARGFAKSRKKGLGFVDSTLKTLTHAATGAAIGGGVGALTEKMQQNTDSLPKNYGQTQDFNG